jgi:hypothetical protein
VRGKADAHTETPSLLHREVVLAEMDVVGAREHSEVGTVVDDE